MPGSRRVPSFRFGDVEALQLSNSAQDHEGEAAVEAGASYVSDAMAEREKTVDVIPTTNCTQGVQVKFFTSDLFR